MFVSLSLIKLVRMPYGISQKAKVNSIKLLHCRCMCVRITEQPYIVYAQVY